VLPTNYVTVVTIDQIFEPFLVLHRNLEAFVRLDAPLVGILALGKAMNILAARPPVARRRQLEGTLAAIAFIELYDMLHAALAVAALADDHRAVVVLKRGRDNFTRAGAKLVDEHSNWEPFGRNEHCARIL